MAKKETTNEPRSPEGQDFRRVLSYNKGTHWWGRLEWPSCPVESITHGDECESASMFGPAVLRDRTGKALGLRVGSTAYAFIEPLAIHCEAESGATFKFSVVGFPPARGETKRKAEERWALEMHGLIQMRSRRDLQPPSESDVDWAHIEELLDLETYRLSRPFTVRQVGQVLARDVEGILVRWSGFEDEEELPFVVGPAELAGFQVYERFDALVEREPETWRLSQILSATLLPTLSSERKRERLEALAKAPSTRDVCADLE